MSVYVEVGVSVEKVLSDVIGSGCDYQLRGRFVREFTIEGAISSAYVEEGYVMSGESLVSKSMSDGADWMNSEMKLFEGGSDGDDQSDQIRDGFGAVEEL